MGWYEDSISVCEYARRICVDYGHYQCLPDIMAIQAEAREFLGLVLD